MEAYGASPVHERHRHRYEVNYEDFRDLFSEPDENLSGRLVISSKAAFVEAIELPGRDFFLGIQYHPEFGSKVGRPSPLFRLFVERVRGRKKD